MSKHTASIDLYKIFDFGMTLHLITTEPDLGFYYICLAHVISLNIHIHKLIYVVFQRQKI